MKYLVLLGLVVGCSESDSLSTHINSLRRSTESLRFSTYTLECLNSFNGESLRDEFDRLNLPRTIKVSRMFVDSKLHLCISAKYRANAGE